jgi:hypothetical protein
VSGRDASAKVTRSQEKRRLRPPFFFTSTSHRSNLFFRRGELACTTRSV